MAGPSGLIELERLARLLRPKIPRPDLNGPARFRDPDARRQRPCDQFPDGISRGVSLGPAMSTRPRRPRPRPRALVVEISKYPATSKARASEAVLSSSLLAVTSPLGL